MATLHLEPFGTPLNRNKNTWVKQQPQLQRKNFKQKNGAQTKNRTQGRPSSRMHANALIYRQFAFVRSKWRRVNIVNQLNPNNNFLSKRLLEDQIYWQWLQIQNGQTTSQILLTAVSSRTWIFWWSIPFSSSSSFAFWNENNFQSNQENCFSNFRKAPHWNDGV